MSRQTLLASEHGAGVVSRGHCVTSPGVRDDSGAVSDVSGGGGADNRGAVTCVIIDSDNSGGADTGVVTWNMNAC